GEAEDEERRREARLVDEAAEQRVGRHAFLCAQRRDERERRDRAQRQHDPALGLRQQLARFDAGAAECAPRAHDGSLRSVSCRNTVSSDRSRGCSDRTATPALPSAMTYASTASRAPVTSRPSPASARRVTRTPAHEPAIVNAVAPLLVPSARAESDASVRSRSTAPSNTTRP